MQTNKINQPDETTKPKTLRIWPAIIIVLLQWVGRFVTPIFAPEALMVIMLSVMIGFVVIIIWWAFFSRAPRLERWIIAGLLFVVLIAIWPLLHESMRLQPYVAYLIPVFSLAFVAWSIINRNSVAKLRRFSFVATMLLVSVIALSIRAEGMRGDASVDFAWRWQQSVEENLAAETNVEMVAMPEEWSADKEPEWPGFRGPNRDGIVYGTNINMDWQSNPPKELWKKNVGPGWSSFCVQGPLFFTQEQLGENEVVSCYVLESGKLVWQHKDKTRFWEANGGAGPRGTPTIHDGRLYALGATGIMNVLHTSVGTPVWSRNAAKDSDTKVPMWGFSGSPLVLDNKVIVALAGSIIAYDLNNGEPVWFKSIGGDCYSSPHLITIDGITQVLLLNDAGAISLGPEDGKLFWEYKWEGHPIVQPALTENGNLLLSVDERTGVKCIKASYETEGWIVEELWTSARIKPYFNDSVVHDGYLYGFHGNSLSCISLKNGGRTWKGGRYGRGQILLLADQDLLIALSEKGDVALLNATSDQHIEIARFKALKGKTWNHPVLVNDVLLVRNSQEMAAYKLALSE